MNFIDTIVETKSILPETIQAIKGQRSPLVMYGAGQIAGFLYNMLIDEGVKIDSVVVDNDHLNNPEFFGTQIYPIEDVLEKYKELNIMVAFCCIDYFKTNNKLKSTGKVKNVYFLMVAWGLLRVEMRITHIPLLKLKTRN